MFSTNEIVTLSDLELDIAIAQEVLKTKILGTGPCYSDNGGLMLEGSSYTLRPITFRYDSKCSCDLVMYKEMEDKFCQDETSEQRAERHKREFFLGHEAVCLTAIPPYSQWLDEAILMVQTYHPCSWSLTYIDRLWVAEINDEFGTYTTKMPGEIHDDHIAARVLCCSVLRSVRKLPDPKSPNILQRWFNKFFICPIIGHDEHGFGGSYGWSCQRCEL